MVRGEPEPVEQLGVGEAPPDDLVQAAPDQRVLGGAPDPLGVGEPSGGAPSRGERGGQTLEPVDPGDLLDQVDLARDVLAAHGGHAHAQPPLDRLDLEVEHAEDRVDPLLAQEYRLPGGRHPSDVDGARRDARAAQVDHQAACERLGVHALLWCESLLEAP